MGLPRFFKLPSHSVFDYKPLYYDQRKEEREERNKKIKQELGINENEEYKPNIKGQMRRAISVRRHSNKSSNIRLLVILIGLVALAYYIFYF